MIEFHDKSKKKPNVFLGVKDWAGHFNDLIFLYKLVYPEKAFELSVVIVIIKLLPRVNRVRTILSNIWQNDVWGKIGAICKIAAARGIL